jgi:hypothetical protein
MNERHERPQFTAALVAAIVAAAIGGSLMAQQPPAPPSCDDPHYSDFDFWVGDWVVTDPKGDLAGENTVEKILNGCLVKENWRGAQGSIGQSFNMYYARVGEWRQNWVDGSGGRLDIAGGLDEKGRMVLKGEMPGREGGRVLHEITYTPNADGTVTQYWRASKDAGDTWIDMFLGTYTRKQGS